MRLITRSDFDGLMCGALLKAKNMITDVKFVHPKDLQDGIIEVTSNDILANVPYVEGCGIWFDHHLSEVERLGYVDIPGATWPMDSAARVIYEYYDGKLWLPQFADVLDQVDRVDSGKLTADDVMNPKEWVLLGFLMDPRTGLGRFRNFKISNLDLMTRLMDMCYQSPIDQILEDENVKERVDLYNEQAPLFEEMLIKHTMVEGNVIITDLRGVDPINAGNRFKIYWMYPDQNISMWIVDGRAGLNVSIACGYSINNRSAEVDIGGLMLSHGGGGHHQVGTCQVATEVADQRILEIAKALNGV